MKPSDSHPAVREIVIETRVAAPSTRAWHHWVHPCSIEQWNAASDDWHCPRAVNDLRVGGTFSYQMAARDGSAAFEFTGTFTEVEPNKVLACRLDDGRTVRVSFQEADGHTLVTESFEPESVHSIELQRAGWQAILDRFKAFVESIPSHDRQPE